MARPRTGSVYYNGGQRRWYGVISLGGGKRRAVTGKTEAEVRQRLAGLGVEPPPTTERRDYRGQGTAVAAKVLERSELMGWDRETTARVMAASMTVKRIRRLVAGPCVYCGDEFADTIDHVIPYAEGGQDSPPNVVSSCWSCNARKGKRPVGVLGN